MKNIFNYKINTVVRLLALSFLLAVGGCETLDRDESLQIDPSLLDPSRADINLILNNVQNEFVKALAENNAGATGVHVRAAEFVRMQHLFGTYTGPFSLTPANINALWTDFYTETLNDARTLIAIGEAQGNRGHVGIAKLIEAYSFVVLVDTFARVPFSEALKGSEGNFNPVAEDGSVIYEAMFALIEEAKADILASKAAGNFPEDLMYAGDADKWVKLANTLTFKMLIQTRLVDTNAQEKINAILTQPMIDTNVDDFQFQYLSVNSPVDNRHPSYIFNYGSGGANDYMNSFYVKLLLDDKGFSDPRLRYYFYRQVEENPSGDDLPCADSSLRQNFCSLGSFYWTRDHQNNDGVSPDQLRRTTYGLYPVGGAFDADDFESVAVNDGAEGAGIFPIMLASYVKFLRAEAAITLNTSDNAREMLEAGIKASMDKVLKFNEGQVSSDFAATDADVAAYITFVLDKYDAAANNDERLDIIMEEYYIALWGNGYEAWNNYRRTSLPSRLLTDAAPVLPSPGAFPRSFIYPAAAINLNNSLEEKGVDVRVFWDTNDKPIN
ncbi:SusD/RagB family nutrient-binding outer membrane lipoprotein [Aquimarina agarivorans]|uniref:SusD/RagB family nutrient-binding outer membrane lipoprotein n=1 Tax=Aquimarina agarivorans TaxID=980584 RepID=UPI000248ECFF|nr:SusD/RagB family nutrient-binding outer membrane lipoprotein [Aquimarina agarivorans]